MNESHIFADRPWLKSYLKGVSSDIEDLPYHNLVELIDKSASRYKNKISHTVSLPNGIEAHLTFQEVSTLANWFASFLRLHLRLQKGDRVAIQMPNCFAYPVCVFGVLKAGCVVVNVNPLYTETEMEHLLQDATPEALVIIDMFQEKIDDIISKTSVKTVIRVSIADLFPLHLRSLIKSVLFLKKEIPNSRLNAIPFDKALSMGKDLFHQYEPFKRGFWGHSHSSLYNHSTKILPDDEALLQYTGGTTGKSKAAILTHRNIIANCSQLIEFGRYRVSPGNEVILTALPLYHVFAFTVNLITFFALGGQNILIPNPRPISNLQKAFNRHKITWVTGVNTLFHALTESEWFCQNPPSSLRVCIAGGMALKDVVAQKWLQITKCEIAEGYGMTETSPVICFNPIGGKIKPGTIGVPIPGTWVKLCDENGKEVPIGKRGELYVKGPQVMKEYWKQPEETAFVFKEGWLCTGDAALMDEDGYFKIVDRMKDIIVTSGFNVAPSEVESVLLQHPDVLECVVLGLEAPVLGEYVVAVVVSRTEELNETLLRIFCKKYLTSYKVPRKIFFRKELPKSNVGKILKRVLKQELQ